jgi:hypothetical protein
VPCPVGWAVEKVGFFGAEGKGHGDGHGGFLGRGCGGWWVGITAGKVAQAVSYGPGVCLGLKTDRVRCRVMMLSSGVNTAASPPPNGGGRSPSSSLRNPNPESPASRCRCSASADQAILYTESRPMSNFEKKRPLKNGRKLIKCLNGNLCLASVRRQNA